MKVASQLIFHTVEMLCVAEGDDNTAINADCIFFTGPQTLIQLS